MAYTASGYVITKLFDDSLSTVLMKCCTYNIFCTCSIGDHLDHPFGCSVHGRFFLVHRY